MLWGLTVPHLSQKVANFYKFRSNLGQSQFRPKKAGFFLIFYPVLQGGLLKQNLGSLIQEIHLCSCFRLLAVVFSQFCSNII